MKKNKAEREASNLLKDQKINKPPVAVERIAEKLGAKLSFEPFEGKDDISGALYRDDKIIGINSAHPYTRQRFSIAHEIGHLILHDDKLSIDKVVRVNFRNAKSSLAIDPKEIEANAFASELLMPRELIKKEIEKILSKRKSFIDKDELINKMAKIFKVSPQAMEYKLNNLGIISSH